MMDASATPAEVVTAASTLGFFSQGRVIGIRDWKPLLPSGGRRGRAKAAADDPALAAATALSYMPDVAQLLLLAAATVPATNPLLKLAQQKGEVRSFARLRWRDLLDWSSRRAREIGLVLDNRAVRALVDAAGDDLRLIDSELTKLATYAAGERLTEADVRALVPDTAEHQVWDLTDSLLGNPGRAAIELDRALGAGEPPGRLSYMLVRHLRLVLAASAAESGSGGAQQLTAAFAGDGRPLSDFAVSKAFAQAEGVDRRRLESLYRRAASVEAASRRGEMEDDQALRLLVLEAALT
jgi:DNA polymerase-3 subunit delta